MAGMYRDRVSISGGEPIRANVYVVSAASIVSNGGLYDKRTIIVSISPRQVIAIEPANSLTWRGEEYLVQDSAVPIMALGRLDHWEITAIREIVAQ